MDFKEITTKAGKRVVFCRLDELLMASYHANNMEEVKPHVNNAGEYIIHCPFCKAEGHKKHKLYIKEDLSEGHCFVCTRAFVNVRDDVNVDVRDMNFLDKLYGHQEFKPVYLNDPTWTLDRYKYEFDDYSEVGYNYLIGRHGFMKDLYKVLGFRFLDDNVVMPFFYHGDVFYYQIRFTGNSKIRYYFPPISAKPPYIIERNDNRKFIIVEGVYDAIAAMIMAPEYTPMAVLGSSISSYQLEFLKEYTPEDIIVYMDDTEKSCNIANRLKGEGIFSAVHIIKSDGEDPEEYMKRILKTGGNLQWITSEKFNTNLFKYLW